MLRVVPPIIIAPSIDQVTTPLLQNASEDYYTTPGSLEYASTHVIGVPSTQPGPPLGRADGGAGAAVTVDAVDVTAPSALGAAFVESVFDLGVGSPQPSGALIAGTTAQRLYVPEDFTNLGIPYACPICFKTFRTVRSLTEHMNSPVHDPDAFMCPKCDGRFGYVSALIQHLESGSCKLASHAEIFERFERLTASFSRLLKA